MHILVTGGAGYIGSHTTVLLLEAGHEVTVIDDLSNANPQALERVAGITGRGPHLIVADVTDAVALDSVFRRTPVEAVIHFAGLKAVGESVSKPLEYYRTNIGGTLTLCETMRNHGCFTLVFSSSATVYGDADTVPVTEDMPADRATNPYGESKVINERILSDLAGSDSRWSITSLRYFNPVGAHPSGLIGEDPTDVPNNLMPYIAQVAVRRLPMLRVFGDDYPTRDGTGVRDYIHVMDLAEGHLAALDHPPSGIEMYNLGTGQGTTVMEIVAAFERASGAKIPYEIVDRRPGDVAALYADVSKAAQDLQWRATRGLDEMCTDTWAWQSNNPHGYD